MRTGIRRTVVATAMAIATTMLVPHAAQAGVDPTGAPDEAVAAVQEAVRLFEQALETHRDCLGEPEIRFEDLPGRRGEYRLDGTIVINPHRSVDGMLATTVHELGHHLMFACGFSTDAGFRDDFYDAQGLDRSHSWLDYTSGWNATPAKHFAEAVVLLVLGTDHGRIALSERTLDLLGPPGEGQVGRSSTTSVRPPVLAVPGVRPPDLDPAPLRARRGVHPLDTPRRGR